MKTTDKTLLFDTSAITGSTDTLSAAINSSVTTIPFTSGAMTKDGTYFQIDSEIFYITAGAGGMSITADRAQLGTTAASHSSGATINVAGALTFSLLAISQVPNQEFFLKKTSNDINYVVVQCASGDTLDSNGATEQILADSSEALGTLILKAPGGN
jgi:hypothetical protein